MKRSKKEIGIALLEGLVEVILSLVFFGIGAFVVGLFGVKIDSLNVDGELLVLIGIAALFAIFGLVYVLVKWVGKKIESKRKGNNTTELKPYE